MTYPHERQVEYWTSRAIEEYFDNERYSVIALPNTPRVEHLIPFDHLFAGQRVKVFGLQYKRLHPDPDHWRLEKDQHGQMKNYDWIYYALSQVRHIHQHRNALHMLQLTDASFAWRARLRPEHLGTGRGRISYARWGGFVQLLLGCSYGWQLRSKEEANAALGVASDLAEALIDLYFLAPAERLVARVSPFVADVGGIDGEDFDLGID
jgi:hypothetical protein